MNDDAKRYTIHEEPLFGTLEVMDVQRLIDETDGPWVNWTLCRVNDSLIRLGVLHGEFHWHKHDDGTSSSCCSTATSASSSRTERSS